MVVMDATVLLYVFNDKASPPTDPQTGKPIECCAERVNFLLKTLEASKTKVVIPTPALSEVLVHASAAGPAYLAQLERLRFIKIANFDKLAAVEAAEIQRGLIASSGSIKLTANSPRAKAKFDTQIVAIAKVEQATTIYSDDEGIQKLGKRLGMMVIGIARLPLPPEDPQGSLPLNNDH